MPRFDKIVSGRHRRTAPNRARRGGSDVGITACVGHEDISDTLLSGLENLEYRGYDSSGIATNNGHGITVVKREGKLRTWKPRSRRPTRTAAWVSDTRAGAHTAPDGPERAPAHRL